METGIRAKSRVPWPGPVDVANWPMESLPCASWDLGTPLSPSPAGHVAAPFPAALCTALPTRPSPPDTHAHAATGQLCLHTSLCCPASCGSLLPGSPVVTLCMLVLTCQPPPRSPALPCARCSQMPGELPSSQLRGLHACCAFSPLSVWVPLQHTCAAAQVLLLLTPSCLCF